MKRNCKGPPPQENTGSLFHPSTSPSALAGEKGRFTAQRICWLQEHKCCRCADHPQTSCPNLNGNSDLLLSCPALFSRNSNGLSEQLWFRTCQSCYAWIRLLPFSTTWLRYMTKVFPYDTFSIHGKIASACPEHTVIATTDKEFHRVVPCASGVSLFRSFMIWFMKTCHFQFPDQFKYFVPEFPDFFYLFPVLFSVFLVPAQEVDNTVIQKCIMIYA